jgi:hypothetical protein
MGLSFKIFVVQEDDTVMRFSLARFNRLLQRDPNERLTHYANKRIRVALMAVEMIDRKPVEITREQYSFLDFDSEGLLDLDERDKRLRLVSDMLEPMPIKKVTGKVVDAKYKFAKKRYKNQYVWNPTPAIKATIKAIIFRK